MPTKSSGKKYKTAEQYKVGMSWGEVATFDECVERIRRAALSIAKESRAYIVNGTMVSDGEIFTSNIKGDLLIIQNCAKKINALSKRYGNL